MALPEERDKDAFAKPFNRTLTNVLPHLLLHFINIFGLAKHINNEVSFLIINRLVPSAQDEVEQSDDHLVVKVADQG